MQDVKTRKALLFALPLALLIGQAQAAVISWAGYQWDVRSGGGGPGPNNWDERNVWVDADGKLHLKIANRNGVWSSAEVRLLNPARTHFGLYQFQIEARPELFDKNVVFGFFTYPSSDVGADATHEIDIEFARWGLDNAPFGNYTVWPTVSGAANSWHGFTFSEPSGISTHRFAWQADRVDYQSLAGRVDAGASGRVLADWRFMPSDPAGSSVGNTRFSCSSGITSQCLSQSPQQFLINLWQFQGRAPSDGKEVEVVLSGFSYIPNGTLPTGATPTPTATPTASPTPTPTPTARPTATPTPTVTPTPSATPTATPTPGSGCYAGWSARSYAGGSKVSLNGRNYEAKWWAEGNEIPGKTGEWGVWKDVGACGGAITATPTATATPTVTPTATPTATPTPVATATPTSTPTTTPACPAWQEGVAYAVNACVSYQGKTYRCSIAHTPPAGGGWTPAVVPALWQN
ncbi:carbohydrate-binding protein [Chitinilyticum litopenaei]|uniref:carbohydrate-binding protein n=1 Tax=Chitinilyticum litopenaei TaxID=1121276 RepID=UPI000400CE70|nr:carbohydrate-binding protein [Chitinilyticum litopenaei]